MDSVPDRSEIDEKYKWNLESIYATDDEWENDYEDAQDLIDDLAEYEGRATEDGETLLEVIELYQRTARLVEKVSAYARMRSHEDTRDDQYQTMVRRVGSLYGTLRTATNFFEPEIQSLDREELDAMMAETPGLERYDHHFEQVFRLKPHTPSTEVQDLLAELKEVLGTPGEIYSMLTNADMTFPTVENPDGEVVEMSLSNFTTLLKHPDRAFRREVYEAFYDEWETVENTVATAYEKGVRKNVTLARVKNFDTAREASLHGPNIPVEVYDTLVETVHDNLDVLHRHLNLKQRALGVDELQMWDIYRPMSNDEEPAVTYEEAKEYVIGAVGHLGEEYRRRVRDGLPEWVDVYENRGKRSGAYSGGTYDTQPFILLNYQNDVSSMYTLVHELGHSMHSQLASEHQPYVYGNPSSFTSEVVSNVNEVLLTHHLLETVEDDPFRRTIIEVHGYRLRNVLYSQALFAEFERRVHAMVEDGEALTVARLHELYGDLKETYYEPVTGDERTKREWMRVPHLYSSFYVFRYATGISAAITLARDLIDGDDSARERYLDLLGRGARGNPIELLQDAGVDLTSPDPIERAIDAYDEHLDEMRVLVD